MKLHLALLTLALVASASAQLPGNPAAEQITKLRAQREKAIGDAVAKANADYAASLEKLKGLYPSDPQAGALVSHEKEELAKVAIVTVPPAVKITAEIPQATKTAHKKPVITRPDDLARYLVGTKWSFYHNDKFAGDAKVLEFTGPGKATLDGKEQEWKVLDKGKIWLTGNKEYSFNKNFDEFTGGWVPNPRDRDSGRLIE